MLANLKMHMFHCSPRPGHVFMPTSSEKEMPDPNGFSLIPSQHIRLDEVRLDYIGELCIR